MLVSIVMATYNCNDYISRAIDSIISQTYKEWELIIVNDGSTDDTVKTVETYIKKYSNISLYSIKNSGSARYPRLFAVSLAKGEWICNIDSDDWVEPNFLQIQIDHAIKYGADVVTPTMVKTDGEIEGATVPLSTFKHKTVYTGKEAAGLTFQYGTGSYIASGNGYICKKEIYPILNDKEPKSKLYVYQDEIDHLDMLLMAKTVTISDAKYYYFTNLSSVTHKPSVKSYDKLITEIEYKEIVIKNFYDDQYYLSRINIRFLDMLIRRRLKYLSAKSCFSNIEKQQIEEMFHTSYQSLSRSCSYSVIKKIFRIRRIERTK